MTGAHEPSIENLENLCKEIFEEADTSHDGNITFVEFNMWMRTRSPVKSTRFIALVLIYMYSIFQLGGFDFETKMDLRET